MLETFIFVSSECFSVSFNLRRPTTPLTYGHWLIGRPQKAHEILKWFPAHRPKNSGPEAQDSNQRKVVRDSKRSTARLAAMTRNNTYAYIHIHSCTQLIMCVFIHIHMYLRIYAYKMYICMCVSIYTHRIYVCMCMSM